MSAPLTLAIDVGNSRIKTGLFRPPAADALPEPVAAAAFPVRDPNPATTLARWLSEQAKAPTRRLLAGVNPAIVASIQNNWPPASGELTLLGRPSRDLLRNRTDAPDRVGLDRLHDAVAANRLRPPGVPAIVVGSGTSTTVNYVDSQGVFRGGAILPGFEIVAAALHERTAQLPLIDATEFASPPDPLGRNTDAALRSGLYWGLVGGVKELVAWYSRMAAVESETPPLLLLTGGASPLLAPHLPAARVEPYLTMQGMVLSSHHEMRSP